MESFVWAPEQWLCDQLTWQNSSAVKAMKLEFGKNEGKNEVHSSHFGAIYYKALASIVTFVVTVTTVHAR